MGAERHFPSAPTCHMSASPSPVCCLSPLYKFLFFNVLLSCLGCHVYRSVTHSLHVLSYISSRVNASRFHCFLYTHFPYIHHFYKSLTNDTNLHSFAPHVCIDKTLNITVILSAMSVSLTRFITVFLVNDHLS